MVKDRLVWIDLEMTGLYPEENTIIEIATIVTESDLSIVAEGPSFAIDVGEAEAPGGGGACAAPPDVGAAGSSG